MAEEQVRYQSLLAGLPELIVITGPDLVVLEAFGAAPRNACFDPGRLPGRSAETLFSAGDRAQPQSASRDLDLRSPGRTVLPVAGPVPGVFWEVLIVPLGPGSGDGIGIRIKDMVPDTAACDHLTLVEHQLAEAQRWDAIGRLSSGIAHEITTPAQYVTDNLCFLKEAWPEVADLLSRRPPAETEQSPSEGDESVVSGAAFLMQELPQAIDQAYEGALRIGAITHSMREFARSGSDEMAEADLHRIIQNTVTVARNRWKHVAEVVMDLDSSPLLVLCIASDIGQIILNLLVNAVDAVAERREAEGSRRLGTIAIRTRAAGSGARVEIEDDGLGIPQALQAKIFIRFFTTKPPGQGTGQGLPICKDLIERRHGGRIEVDSAPGSGTRFILWIPGVPVGREGTDALVDAGAAAGAIETL
jgi:signal transduction histidine kinase